MLLFAGGLCMSAPLMGQDSGYESDGNNRQFNFNPGNMMNRMSNPMRNMFGSSQRRYDDYDYPGPGYPPAYPPGYGYPGYQAPYPGYGQANQLPPAPSQATPYNYPSAVPVPAQPAAPAAAQVPDYTQPPAAATPYPSAYSQPDQASHYRFRPLEAGAAPQNSPPAPTPADSPAAMPSQQSAPVAAGTSLGRQPAPLPPLSYPQTQTAGEPLAPISYPQTPAAAATAAPSMSEAPATLSDPGLRFRPLDKPGYSSDLDQTGGTGSGNP
jgi:hypothetical protein